MADGCLDWRPPCGGEAIPADPAAASRGDSQLSRETRPPVERVILLRGVVWQGQDVDAFKLWQDLMRFWPTPFADEHTPQPGSLFAHAGRIN